MQLQPAELAGDMRLQGFQVVKFVNSLPVSVGDMVNTEPEAEAILQEVKRVQPETNVWIVRVNHLIKSKSIFAAAMQRVKAKYPERKKKR